MKNIQNIDFVGYLNKIKKGDKIKMVFLVFLLCLFIISIKNALVIPISVVILLVLCYKKMFNSALLVLLALFIISIVFNNKIEFFNQESIPISTPTSTPTQPSTPIPTIYIEENTVIGVDTYTELKFVLESLLDNDYLGRFNTNIVDIIEHFKLTDLFSIFDKIIDKDKDKKNKKFNNFLERIVSCKDDDGYNTHIEDEHYKKLYVFNELIRVYTFDSVFVINLMVNHNVTSLCDLSMRRKDIFNKVSNVSYGYELLGLEYYLNERTFNDKYYSILKLIGLDESLEYDKNIPMSLKKELYHYHHENKVLVKDLNSVMVLFDFYNIFGEYTIAYNQGINSDELNLSLLRNINIDENENTYWTEGAIGLFDKYNVKGRIIDTKNSLTRDELTEGFTIEDFVSNDPPIEDMNTTNSNSNYSTNVGNQITSFQDQFNRAQTSETNINNDIKAVLEKKISLDYIRQKLLGNIVDIIDDIIVLMSRRCNIDCNNTNTPLFSKFVFYLKELFLIIAKGERMFFVGIVLLVVSILLNFIIASV